jgi:hypothetical protein
MGDVSSCQQVFFCFLFKGLLNTYWNVEMGPTVILKCFPISL